MLPKENRLRKKKDFDLVFKIGKVAGSANFFLKHSKNNLNVSRIGFICSKKVSKKATQRNRIKRYLRETARGFLPLMRASEDIIVLAKPGSAVLDFHQTKDEVSQLFKRAGLM